ncbi:MAG: peptidoglycan editing factor PgeF [Anaerolineales bacterium]
MPFEESNGLRYFQFESFSNDWFDHGIFTRRGGVSEEHFASLNVGATVGDDPDKVIENRRRVFDTFGRHTDSAFDIWQVHSAEILVATEPRQGEPYPRVDGVVTNRPGVTLSMRFADCVPIMLMDPVHRSLALIHAGWQGTVRGAASAGVQKMVEAFGTRPKDLVAGIGPSIRQHHYPVGLEVIQAFRQSVGHRAEPYVSEIDGQFYLDLAGANADALDRLGVQNIEDPGLCTACDLEDWYSHRGQGGKAGRFAAIMGIR